MPRKKTERLIQFNRENILETAEKLFSEKGIKETTVDDISKAADCSKSTIYVYFKSKDEIYNFIICNYMYQLRDVVDTCIKEYKNFEDCYFRVCKMLVEIYEQHPLYFESMMGNISVNEKELEENEILHKIYDVGETITENMLMLFEKGLREDYVKPNLLVLPAVFTLWASLANIILMANQKEKYIEKKMNLNKSEFMQYSFELLLLSIKKGGK